MKKPYIYLLIAVVVALGGLGIYWAMNQNNNTNTMNSMDMNNNSSNDDANKTSETNSVTIQNFAFSPVNISVKAGTKVTWTNNDSATHTITETDDKTGPNSGNVAPGSSYDFTFTKPGIYHYHCALHPSMTGTVTVN